MSVRGPTAIKGSKGLRWMYVQGFTEQGQVYGGQWDKELQSCCKVVAELILSLKLHYKTVGLI